jgi:hypothetical protein
MPRIRLTKSAIDALPTPKSDVVYWDAGCPGFGVKVTPKGRKVFIVLYHTGGAGSKLRKYTASHSSSRTDRVLVPTPADGYTLLMVGPTQAINATL